MNSYLGLYYLLTPSLKNYYWLRFTKFGYAARWIVSQIIPGFSYVRKQLLVNHLQYILIMTSDHEMGSGLFSAHTGYVAKILQNLGASPIGVVTRDMAIDFVKNSR